MSNILVDSCVVAKWFLPESDSPKAQQMLSDVKTRGDSLIVLDLAIIEVTNVIWKQYHRSLMDVAQVQRLLRELLRAPVQTLPATPLLDAAMNIAIDHGRSIYDSLFVAAARSLSIDGITADEPLWTAVNADFPEIKLLRSC